MINLLVCFYELFLRKHMSIIKIMSNNDNPIDNQNYPNKDIAWSLMINLAATDALG